MRHICMFSGGIGSWATAHRVVQAHGAKNVTLLFADVKGDNPSPHVGEDEDTYRFIDDAAVQLGAELVIVKDGRDIWQVFKDRRFLGNSRQANCSEELKQKPCRKWLRENCDPADTIVYVGIDWTETHRIPAIQAAYLPYRAEAPMTQPPYIDKDEMIAAARALGLEPPRAYALGFPHNNCFHGDTRVPTTEGMHTLRELAEGPGEAMVITSQGWKRAKASSFGEQPLRKITFVRSGKHYTVRATPDHRWPVEEYYFVKSRHRSRGSDRLRRTVVKTTDELRPDDRIARFPVPCRTQQLNDNAVAHGIVYGDGSRANAGYPDSKVLLCGEKAELEHWFPASASRIPKPNGLYIGRLPDWKTAPGWDADPDLWGSFLAGWFAADGSIGTNSSTLSTSKPDDVGLAVHAATVAGVEITNLVSYERTGFGITGPMYEIGLRLPEHMVLRTAHRKNWKPPNFKLQRWTVTEVGPLEPAQTVYCLTVPGPHDFALEYSLGTLNCGMGCVRAGKSQFVLLHRLMPERFKVWEAGEKEIRDHLGRDDVTILTEQVHNRKVPLPLTTLRERLESQGSLFDDDGFDFGGCGCFTE